MLLKVLEGLENLISDNCHQIRIGKKGLIFYRLIESGA